MSSTKNRSAKSVDPNAELKRIAAMADNLDGLLAVWDMAALAMHGAAARLARRQGRELAPPPAPVSRLLKRFTQQLRDKTAEIVLQLRSDEAQRLACILPGFVAALEANEEDVMLLVKNLLPHEPESIAHWLRAHLRVLEQRFAS
jgi:hypothetical protein